MSSCNPLCCFTPQLQSVGNCDQAPITPNLGCGAGVGTASCGMAQVTVTAAKTNVLPWLIGGGLLLWLLARHRRA